MLAVILMAAVLSQETTPSSWCATARRNEPLLQDARRLAAGEGRPDPAVLKPFDIVPADQVRVVLDPKVCARAAEAFQPEWFDGTADANTPAPQPVLVIEVGPVYVVGLRRKSNEGFFYVLADREMNVVSVAWGHAY